MVLHKRFVEDVVTTQHVKKEKLDSVWCVFYCGDIDMHNVYYLRGIFTIEKLADIYLEKMKKIDPGYAKKEIAINTEDIDIEL